MSPLGMLAHPIHGGTGDRVSGLLPSINRCAPFLWVCESPRLWNRQSGVTVVIGVSIAFVADLGFRKCTQCAGIRFMFIYRCLWERSTPLDQCFGLKPTLGVHATKAMVSSPTFGDYSTKVVVLQTILRSALDEGGGYMGASNSYTTF